jgi:hypothetical protein
MAGNHAVVGFGQAESLTAGRGPALGFAPAGEDNVFHRAAARIGGRTVVSASAGAPVPVTARQNRANNSAATLRNAAGLPAGCFSTDEWPPAEVKAATELAVPPAAEQESARDTAGGQRFGKRAGTSGYATALSAECASAA